MTDTSLWSSHDKRISRLEEGFTEVASTVGKLEAEMASTNVLIKGVHEDTSEIRAILSGARAMGKVVTWLGGLASAAVGIYAILEMLK